MSGLTPGGNRKEGSLPIVSLHCYLQLEVPSIPAYKELVLSVVVNVLRTPLAFGFPLQGAAATCSVARHDKHAQKQVDSGGTLAGSLAKVYAWVSSSTCACRI